MNDVLFTLLALFLLVVGAFIGHMLLWLFFLVLKFIWSDE